MKSPKSSGKPKKRKPLLVRRVAGESMAPHLLPGQLVLATGLFRHIHKNDVVVILHNNLEKVKRVQKIKDEVVFLVGDNPAKSTDSRTFGWLPASAIVGKVFWPLQ